MLRSFLPSIACVILAFAGCGPSADYKQPVSSDSTQDLALLLAQTESTNQSMLNIRKGSAIEILGTRGDEALPILLQVAQDTNQDTFVRFAATEAIGNFQQIPEDQISALVKLGGGENGVFLNKVLDRSCKAARKQVVVPLLVDFVKDDRIDYGQRQLVALTLLDIDEPAAVAAGVVKKVNEYLPDRKFVPDIQPVP